MCFDIIRNPAKSIAGAKKRKSMNRTLIVAVESAVLFAVAAAVVMAKTGFSALVLAAAVSAFLFVLICILLFGLIVQIAATTLGCRGKYYEGLTAAAYSTVPMAVGVFVVSLLALVPMAAGLRLMVIALTFALGFSLLYRAIKELFATDMITSFVVVSVSILAVFAAVYVSFGFSMLTNMAALLP